MIGTILHGKAVGRKLGFPTANIALTGDEEGRVNGVYLADVTLPDEGGRTLCGVLNHGNHPTLREGAPTVEIYLLDFDGDLYGRRVLVNYLLFVRPEITFPNVEALKAQIAEDVAFARQWFEARRAREKDGKRAIDD